MHKSRITPNTNNNVYHKSALKRVCYMFIQSLESLIAVLKTHGQTVHLSDMYIWTLGIILN